MTTPIVPSISDEQLAELENLAEGIKGWNATDAFLEPEEGVLPYEWEWHVGQIDSDGNQYPLLHVNAHQYDSDDSEILARYYAACNRAAIQGLIARLRAAEADAKRYRWLRDKSVDADGVFPMVSLTDDCGDQVSNWLFGQAVDKAVDEAMERTP